jgi:hypothetical protein
LNAVRKKLESYLREDPAPRVTKAVAMVIEKLDKIFDEFTT